VNSSTSAAATAPTYFLTTGADAGNANSISAIGIVVHYTDAFVTFRKGASAELQASTSPSNVSSAWI
jgi:hypothetical protein